MPVGQSYIQPAQSTEWETPTELFDALWDEFGGFDLDPCGQVGQHTAQKVWGHGGTVYLPPGSDISRLERAAIDGLAQPWRGKIFMNSPYGLALRKWAAKAVHEVECGNAELVVALVPAKTDVQWWQRCVVTRVSGPTYEFRTDIHPLCSEVRFIKGRLTFRGAPAPAGHASAIVVWRR